MNVDSTILEENRGHLQPLEAPPALSPEEVISPAKRAGGSEMLARLLKMADSYRARNALHQAAEMYFELVECHPDTSEAAKAEQRLIEIGDNYERNGELRQARSIFERLQETAAE